MIIFVVLIMTSSLKRDVRVVLWKIRHLNEIINLHNV